MKTHRLFFNPRIFSYFIILAIISGCSQSYRYAPHRQATPHTPRQAHQQLPSPSQQQPTRPVIKSPRPVASVFLTREKLIQTASRTLGTRYRYGGANPQRGFDCSGLMVYVHNRAGIKIPRTAAEQRKQSRTISYAQLKPGDMLFFKTGKRTDHVGIYIGNRQFIHASTGSRKVKIAKMDSEYWYKRFVKFGTYL